MKLPKLITIIISLSLLFSCEKEYVKVELPDLYGTVWRIDSRAIYNGTFFETLDMDSITLHFLPDTGIAAKIQKDILKYEIIRHKESKSDTFNYVLSGSYKVTNLTLYDFSTVIGGTSYDYYWNTTINPVSIQVGKISNAEFFTSSGKKCLISLTKIN